MPSDAEREPALVRRLAEALRREHRLRSICRTCDLLREAEDG